MSRVVGYHHWCGHSHEAFTSTDLLTQERECERGPRVRPVTPHSPDQCDACKMQASAPRLPSVPERMQAKMLALIASELRRLPVTIMPEDWRGSLVEKALLRLREAVREMNTTS